MKVTYSSYGQSFSSTQLCKPLTSLICPSTATGCICPDTLAANFCDCPTTHYWDSTSSACVARKPLHNSCSNDYECTYNVGLACYATTSTCECTKNTPSDLTA